ncbi:MAG TPA: tetratricopeptide repeat protein [Actinophytocola sp.]|uniref:tetratricopeptide repeat protein n=1 Tax=Actinophytocola sp. TaxID=1872138 RepID=UPI002DB7D230|nr:tetratricopeptide repeat protein [Actinophytocola sp.]HEU5473664.1 tetratricopeptide repeat protein [Actinophytocola sp.]
MNTATALIWPLLAVLGAFVYLALSALVSEELRARVNRLPFVILRLAARRLPPELRFEIHDEEWLPELCYLMGDSRVGPITRLCRGTNFALSVWLRRGGERMARELEVCSPSWPGFTDLRALPRTRRKELAAVTTRLCEVLRVHAAPPDPDWAARLLLVTAAACEAHIEDRNERAAESLARAATRLTGWLDADHPAVLGVRRAAAYAQLQLGRDELAMSLLKALNAAETRVFGQHHPGTFPTLRLLHWAAVHAGRVSEAEAGFRALDASFARLPSPDPALRLHVRCMLSWTLGCRGRLAEAADGYDEVIAERSHRFGPEHPDTLDARHSKGKMYVLFEDGARAYAILRPLLRDRGRVLGRNHPDTLETRKYLAVARALMHPHMRIRRTTVRGLGRILCSQTKELGSNHPSTRDTRHWLDSFAGPTEKS